jgi:hypothetical protein
MVAAASSERRRPIPIPTKPKRFKLANPLAFDGHIGLQTRLKVTHDKLNELARLQDVEPADLLQIFQNAEPQFWAKVAEEIRTRPKYVAEQTGIEQIG